MLQPKDQAGLAQAVAACLALFKLDPERDEQAPAHVLALVNAAEAEQKILLLLDHLLPRHVDAPRWLGWLQGGPAPTSAARLEPPAHDDTKSATGAYQSLLKRIERAAQDITHLKERLAQAEQVEADARAELAAVDENMRATIFFSLFDLMQKIVERASAMGPAFTLARIASGYLQADLDFESKLSDEQRDWIMKHRTERGPMATRVADILDRHTGDEQFEIKVFNTLFAAVVDADKAVEEELKRRAIDQQPLSALAKRPRRRTEAQRGSVHPDAPLHDAPDVLEGLAEAFDHD